MKKIIYSIAALTLFLSACKEKEIVIPELSVGARRVLVEEITGIDCVNCPDGARELQALQEQLGKENLIVVSIHAGQDLSVPLPESQYDFRTTDGSEMVVQIGELFGIPAAAINRRHFPGEDNEFALSGWSSKVVNELKIDYRLGLFVANTYDPASRKLDIKVNIAPDSTISGDQRLTVVITQDSIIDAQNDHSVIIPDYVHRHVLRDVVTPVNGDAVGEALKAGALISKTYSLNLPAAWDANHCTVVAYIHNDGNPNKLVLQVAEDHVVE